MASDPHQDDAEEVIGEDADIGRALARSGLVALMLVMVAGVYALSRYGAAPPEAPDAAPITLPEHRAAPAVQAPQLRFVNVTDESGVDFVHQNLAAGEKLLPETMGGGCALIDYDNDGDQDLVLIDSNRWPWEDPAGRSSSVRLYANDGDGNFSDVTAAVGLTTTCYGMGVAAGDYDNDGDTDLFVTAVGPNCLLRNDGDRFVEVTQAAGVAGEGDAWGASCGWFDYDNDGLLDLIVGNYVTWSPEIDLAQDFRLTGIGRAYGPPFSFAGTMPYLYHNEGDGAFAEVSEQAGLRVTNPATGAPLAKTLGVMPSTSTATAGSTWCWPTTPCRTWRSLISRTARSARSAR